jgi:hypothetical protein
MKKIIGLLLLIIVMGSCSEKTRIPTTIDTDIEEYDFISNSILNDTTLANYGVVSVGDYDYVYSREERVIAATYPMV